MNKLYPKTNKKFTIHKGSPYPMGATLSDEGVNFALFSSRAEKVELCLFDENGKETRLTLPGKDRHIHYGFVPSITAGQRYGYRVYGSYYPQLGLFCNPNKLLADPYAKEIDGCPQYRNPEELAWHRHNDERDNAAIAAKSVVTAPRNFDWQGDCFPNVPWPDTVIYEAHVKGLTKLMPGLEQSGTYAALANPQVIAYLKDLGITAVELLPVQLHLDEYHLQQIGLSNYWGYNTYSHFAVEPTYAADPARAADELRTAVRALHAAGIEVLLDVVYNHTAEQDRAVGLMLSQRGIDNPAWYWQEPNGAYSNWSGTGNTLQLSDRNITRWLMDSLRYWVEEFHIDGFRFDLGAVLGREPGFQSYGRLFQAIYQDPVRATRKMIAEPWDIGPGGYQLGHFPPPFAEWNDRFRDDMRAFWIQESGELGAFAERLAGSSDLFRHHGRTPVEGINFISSHDGFTLRDLVSYNEKHNEANGEENRDGHGHNLSWNHGEEGDTDNPEILKLREHTSKALLASLFLANGTPMLLAGDEFGNSQAGNNNGYCQDNATTWLDWPQRDSILEDYVQQLIALRREIPLLHEDEWWDGRVHWLTADGLEMHKHWEDRDSKALQVLIDKQWLLLVNAKRSEQIFHLPPGKWNIRLAPSQDYEHRHPECRVDHMGIWIFYKKT